MSAASPALLGQRREALEALCTALGEPAYRGRQLAEWLHHHGARSTDEMSSLPLALRRRLADQHPVGRGRVAAEQVSRDGTRKLLLTLTDGAAVETVVLPYADRLSACLSSQTGCAVGCTFCATGTLGAGRNLTVAELCDQLLTAGQAAGARISHVVFMGMGEPLLNTDTVIEAVALWRDEMELSPRHVTVSTVGLPPGIARLASAGLPVTLAVSLHAADDALRRELVPTAAKRWSVAEILAAARDYAARTGRRVTYEMALMSGVNDRPTDAQAAAAVLRRGEHVNLIPFNPVPGLPFERPSAERLAGFRATLESAGLVVTQRQTRGDDIAGACGQLRAAQPVSTGS